MAKKRENSFYLNEKEGKAMKALWSAGKPLSATEIARYIDEEWAGKSIQNIIRTLEAKNAIEVAKITKIGKTYGRLFRPAISGEEYAVNQFKRFYTQDNVIPDILETLVDRVKNNPESIDRLREFVSSL